MRAGPRRRPAATPDSRLIDVRAPEDPAGVVLVLHGGASRRGGARVSPAQLSVLRMIPVAFAVAHAAPGRLAVLRLLNTHRGWDTSHTPLQDVDWALGEVADRFGPAVGVGLVGHSLGGRAALLAVGHPRVRGVVALAPWLDGSERPPDAADTPVVIIHGDADRIANPERSRAFAERAGPGSPISYVSVPDGSHAMLSHRDSFDGLAARTIAWMLGGEPDGDLVTRIAAGEPLLEA